MRPVARACVLVLFIMSLHRGDTVRPKPKMIPSQAELLIPEGDKLVLECQGEGKLQFSTQWNMARVEQSDFYISVNNDSGSYTFTRPRTTRVDTGWYGCAEEGVVIQNDEQTTVHPDTEISWIYVYVNSFEGLAIDTRLTYSAVQIPVVRGNSLVIPCRPTEPDIQVELYCCGRAAREPLWRAVVGRPYDSKIGYTLRYDDSALAGGRCSCATTTLDLHGDPETSDAIMCKYHMNWRNQEMIRIEGGASAQTVRGKNLKLTCRAEIPAAGTTASLYWKVPESIPKPRRRWRQTQKIADVKKSNWEKWEVELIMYDVEITDGGEYICVQEDLINGTLQTATIIVSVLEPGVRFEKEVTRVNASDSATLLCHVVMDPIMTHFTWVKIGDSVTTQVLPGETEIVRLNEFESILYLKLTEVSREDNGTYECRATNDKGTPSSRSSLIVSEVPKVVIDTAELVGTGSAYLSAHLHWVVDEGNDAVKMYSIQQMHITKEHWEDISTNLTGESSHYVIKGLQRNAAYRFRIIASNSIGDSEPAYSKWIMTMDESAGQNGLLALLAGLSGASLLCIIVFVVVWMRIRKRREMAARRRFIEATLERENGVAPDCLDPALNMADQAEIRKYDVKWEFPRKLLKLGKVLGSGAFGTVMKAEAKSLCRGEKTSTVAVKMVRATHRLDHMMALQRELKILAYLGKHVNVVNLLGACTANISYGVLLVIVEYCRFGNLHDYLRSRRDDFTNETGDSALGMTEVAVAGTSKETVILDINTAAEDPCQTGDFVISSVPVEEQAANPDLIEPGQRSRYLGDFEDDDAEPIGTGDLLNWAWQVSRGMKFLGIRRVLHGDLAARNILLADKNVVKICDFGLAKSLVTGEIYKKSGHGPLPIKWMAIESIKDRLFSVNSDVWAFGVVLWELFSLAETPYPGIANDSVYRKLAEGFRMPQPRFADEDLYKTMLRCWDAQPAKRPSFAQLEDKLADLLDEGVKTHYLAFDNYYEELNAVATVTGDTNSATVSSSEDNAIGQINPEGM